MRTIFITPILWKRFDRSALRRGEEGQALVLIAFVVVAMVAMVGLAIDGGLGYLETTRLQRAADAAALAGVQWIPDYRDVADARAQLAAEAQGVKVACYYNTGLPANDPYNQRCRRAVDAEMRGNAPNERYTFSAQQLQSVALRYQVTLGKMQGRVFLGVIGFPNYPIYRSATAEYARLVRFGSSFNYFGTLGVMSDHYMRCDLPNLADCGGDAANLSMYGTTYQRYVLSRCEQPNPPTPVCVGGFWGHIAGPNMTHSNGDAYNGIRDGAGSTGGGSGPLGGVTVNPGAGISQQCLQTADPTTWFVDQVFTDPGSGTPCTLKNGSNIPIRNYDRHPDSPTQTNGFGYELGIAVDPAAIWNFSDTIANVANHTNLNVTIFDGAIGELGRSETFSTSDDYQNGGSLYGRSPYQGFAYQNQLVPTATWQSKQFVCSPGTGTALNNCNPAAIAGSNPSVSRLAANDPTQACNPGGGNYSACFPDTNNLELTYNDVRTRLTLYGPPSVAAIPSTYGNVSGNKLGQFELSDMSVRWRDANPNPQQPIELGGYQKYCYVIFDDVKALWDNTRSGGTTPISQNGTGPDYAYNLINGVPQLGNPKPQGNRYAYVCPANGTNPQDYRYNQLKGTPTARYGTGALGAANTRTVQSGILDTGTAAPFPNDIAANPIAGGSITNNYGTTTTNADPSQNPGITSIWNGPKGNYQQVADPAQDCRRSAIDADGWPIDPLWGHNRIPFNMAYGDPLVNRAWITATQTITNPVAQGKIAGYYSLYYSFHGWRCDWDFDGGYTFNPKLDRTNPDSPSLSKQERSLGTPGQWDEAFTMGHPGLIANSYLNLVLQGNGASATAINRETVPYGTSGLDRDFGLQPYLHMTNVAWSAGGAVAADTSLSASTARVRPGTYMLHVQSFGGFGANRYSVKAEYENAKPIPYNLGNKTVTVTPVPNVFAVTAMALYTNASNNGKAVQNVIFDLASIPAENAGTQAVLELWDAGDVGGTGTLGIEILTPSGYGPRVITGGSNNPATWQIPIGTKLTTRLTACPYAITVDSLGLNAQCYTDSFANSSTIQYAYSNTPFYNDQWMLLSFALPSAGDYNTLRLQCATNNVPAELCYYFQINYKLSGGTMVANDTTTWQLVVQGQPVHLTN